MFFRQRAAAMPSLEHGIRTAPEFHRYYDIRVAGAREQDILDAYTSACALEDTDGYDAVRILLDAPRYNLTRTLVLDQKSRSILPIVFEAPQGCTLSGGIHFRGGFERWHGDIYRRELKVKNPFRQLYADGRLCTMSRLPKKTEITGRSICRENGWMICGRLNFRRK